MARRQVVILGSTGSIGTQALEVVREHPGDFEVVALAAGGNSPELFHAQVEEFSPRQIALGKAVSGIGAPSGQEAIAQLAGAFPEATVVNGITGGVGLGATLAALRCGATVALANKESLVVGGSLIREAMVRPGQIVPVDSEHSAIAQALRSGCHERGLTSPVQSGKSELSQLVLTASGGPFRGKRVSELKQVTVEKALSHPTWKMGPVVTINSSTLMNKGLELIEAALLFDVPADQIVPVIHPQSLVHSMVTWRDGSTVAQASIPDMKVPIALGMAWPEHLPTVGKPISWDITQSWEFEPVDHEVFPAIKLAAGALAESASHPAVLNAANEVAVDSFLAGNLPWLRIVAVVEEVLAQHEGISEPTLEDILEVQRWASARAEEIVTAVA